VRSTKAAWVNSAAKRLVRPAGALLVDPCVGGPAGAHHAAPMSQQEIRQCDHDPRDHQCDLALHVPHPFRLISLRTDRCAVALQAATAARGARGHHEPLRHHGSADVLPNRERSRRSVAGAPQRVPEAARAPPPSRRTVPQPSGQRGVGAGQRRQGREGSAHDRVSDVCRSTRRRRSALPITDTELKLIAAAAMMGERRMPKNGYRTPAATGTPSAL